MPEWWSEDADIFACSWTFEKVDDVIGLIDQYDEEEIEVFV